MEEKYLQKQQEYTFTVPRAEGQKVYHFGARRFKLLAGAVLVCTVCMVGALGYMGYNFYQFRQERTDFLEYQAKKGELEAQLQSLLADNEKMLRDMSEITTLETKLRRALIRDTDSTKLGSDLSSASGETATAGNAPRYLGQGGPADLGVKEMAAVLTAQNKNMAQQIDEKKTSMSELLSELEGRKINARSFLICGRPKVVRSALPTVDVRDRSVAVTTGIPGLTLLLNSASRFTPVRWGR